MKKKILQNQIMFVEHLKICFLLKAKLKAHQLNLQNYNTLPEHASNHTNVTMLFIIYFLFFLAYYRM